MCLLYFLWENLFDTCTGLFIVCNESTIHCNFIHRISKDKVYNRTLKRHISIGDFVLYIHTGSSVPNIPSKSRDLADENNKIFTEWKWSETTYFILSSAGSIYVNIMTNENKLNISFICIFQKLIIHKDVSTWEPWQDKMR